MAKEDYNCVHRLRVRWAEVVYVNADPKTMKAAPLPEDVRQRVRSFEHVAPTEN